MRASYREAENPDNGSTKEGNGRSKIKLYPGAAEVLATIVTVAAAPVVVVVVVLAVAIFHYQTSPRYFKHVKKSFTMTNMQGAEEGIILLLLQLPPPLAHSVTQPTSQLASSLQQTFTYIIL